jgi:hypothetical protein
MAHIRTWVKAEESISPQAVADYEWVRQNRDWLYEQYGEAVILVYRQQVLGSGQNESVALAAAEAQFGAADGPELTPITAYVRDPKRLSLSGGLIYLEVNSG